MIYIIIIGAVLMYSVIASATFTALYNHEYNIFESMVCIGMSAAWPFTITWMVIYRLVGSLNVL